MNREQLEEIRRDSARFQTMIDRGGDHPAAISARAVSLALRVPALLDEIDRLTQKIKSFDEFGSAEALRAMVERLRVALGLIGTKCENFTFNSHWTCATAGGKSPYARYEAEQWCRPCIARTALTSGDFPERGTSGVEETPTTAEGSAEGGTSKAPGGVS